MHVLLVNDDGIHAPGLEALAASLKFIAGVSHTIVAPATEQSECGHRLTTKTPLLLQQIEPHRYSVNGSPADCVRVALHHLKLKPDWVFSGINAGGNMGQDIPVSGTVAAVREATYHGYRAASFSHYLIRELGMDWDRAARWVAKLIEQHCLSVDKMDGSFINFNLPHLPPGECPFPEVKHTTPARSPLPVVYAHQNIAANQTQLLYGGRYADRLQDEGSDVSACFSGAISCSRVELP